MDGGWVERCMFECRWLGGWRDLCLDIDGWVGRYLYIWI